MGFSKKGPGLSATTWVFSRMSLQTSGVRQLQMVCRSRLFMDNLRSLKSLERPATLNRLMTEVELNLDNYLHVKSCVKTCRLCMGLKQTKAVFSVLRAWHWFVLALRWPEPRGPHMDKAIAEGWLSSRGYTHGWLLLVLLGQQTLPDQKKKGTSRADIRNSPLLYESCSHYVCEKLC